MNLNARALVRALLVTGVVVVVAGAGGPEARADAITEWNVAGGQVVVEAKVNASVANRALAIMHAAAYQATNAITRRYATGSDLAAPKGASVDAAVATACRITLLKVMPGQQATIEAAHAAALAKVPEGPSRADGVAVGERAAAAVLAARADDGAGRPETYRPFTTPGVYVPTVVPANPQWPQRTPWLLASPDEFRPGPPPRLDSAAWARDYKETQSLGARNSTTRTVEQTAIARFWEATLPPIYHGIVRSVAADPAREVTRNARLFAAVTEATDDAFIAIFDAKYHYAFWRPITAIRNGDLDGNEATERDPSWVPFIDTPPHPEYPCAHCIQAATIGTVLQGELAGAPTPTLTTVSSSAGGASRSWASVDDFIREVSEARIYDGVHWRTSTEVGVAMGRRVGERAVARILRVGDRADAGPTR